MAGRRRDRYCLKQISLTVGCIVLISFGYLRLYADDVGKRLLPQRTIQTVQETSMFIAKTNGTSGTGHNQTSFNEAIDYNKKDSATKANAVAPNGTIHVILNSYMRSGSTFATNLLTNQSSTFYFYEPLWKFSVWWYFTGDGQMCDTLHSRCNQASNSTVQLKDIRSYTNTSSSEKPLETCYRFLHDVYSCHYDSSLHDLIKEGVTDTLSGASWKPYLSCKKTKGKRACIPEITKACLQSRVRVTKVLRLRVDAYKPILEEDLTLKLVQLVRDPRGIICSRVVKTGWYPLNLKTGNYNAVIENTRSLCNKMLNDFKAGKQLMELFPSRVRFIRYEDLIYENRQSVIEDLYKFLGYEQKPKVLNKPKTSFAWKKLLDKRTLEIVDKECSEVYEALGYVRLNKTQANLGKILSFIPDFDIGK